MDLSVGYVGSGLKYVGSGLKVVGQEDIGTLPPGEFFVGKDDAG